MLDPPTIAPIQSVTADEFLLLSQKDENRYELNQGVVAMMSPAGSIQGDADGSATVVQKGDVVDGEEVLPGFLYSLNRLFTCKA